MKIWVPPVLNFTVAVQRRLRDAPHGSVLVVRSDEMKELGEREAVAMGRTDVTFAVGSEIVESTVKAVLR